MKGFCQIKAEPSLVQDFRVCVCELQDKDSIVLSLLCKLGSCCRAGMLLVGNAMYHKAIVLEVISVFYSFYSGK